MKMDTSLKFFVLQILGVKKIQPTSAMQWGIDHIEHEEMGTHNACMACHDGRHFVLYLASGIRR